MVHLEISLEDDIKLTDEEKDLLTDIATEVLRSEGFTRSSEVSLSFVTSEQIRTLNRDFREVDEETDVLSFPMYTKLELDSLQDMDLGFPVALGDVIISSSKAREQAQNFGHSLQREICYLFTHSMYHLLSYDHMSFEEKAIMREKEEKTLAKFNLNR